MILDGLTQAIGNTPLIKIESLSELTGCNILGKAEFMNPGGSVKDRAALWMVEDAESNGSLLKNGTVVEGTAGNTGIGLAHVCNNKGYDCIIYMPDNQSTEKVSLLKTLGAEVRVVPTVPYADEENYQKQAGRYAKTIENAIWANQFDNTANRLAHYETTGPEIWEQTKGNIDAFTCATGTGGTLAGVSRYLKEQRKDIQIIAADPFGSAIYNWITKGEPVMTVGPSITEGIGNSRITRNLADTQIDGAIQVKDQDMVDMVYSLLHEDGWFLGSSSGINLCSAYELAKKMVRGSTIVTELCDDGSKYQSTLFNQEFLEKKSLHSRYMT